MTLKGVFRGWLLALAVWLVEASWDTISQIVSTWALGFVIPAAWLVHCLANSTEV